MYPHTSGPHTRKVNWLRFRWNGASPVSGLDGRKIPMKLVGGASGVSGELHAFHPEVKLLLQLYIVSETTEEQAERQCERSSCVS